MYFRTASLQKVAHFPDELLVMVYKDETKKLLLARIRVHDPSNPCYPQYVFKPYHFEATSPNFISQEISYVWNFLQERAWFSRLNDYNLVVSGRL